MTQPTSGKRENSRVARYPYRAGSRCDRLWMPPCGAWCRGRWSPLPPTVRHMQTRWVDALTELAAMALPPKLGVLTCDMNCEPLEAPPPSPPTPLPSTPTLKHLARVAAAHARTHAYTQQTTRQVRSKHALRCLLFVADGRVACQVGGLAETASSTRE